MTGKIIERCVVHSHHQIGIGRRTVRPTEGQSPFFLLTRLNEVTEGVPMGTQLVVGLRKPNGLHVLIDTSLLHETERGGQALVIFLTIRNVEDKCLVAQAHHLVLPYLTGCREGVEEINVMKFSGDLNATRFAYGECVGHATHEEGRVHLHRFSHRFRLDGTSIPVLGVVRLALLTQHIHIDS